MQTKQKWIGLMCLLALPAVAGGAKTVPAAERYARKCQRHAPSRFIDLQGTMLWGTWSGWTEKERARAVDGKSVLVSANLEGLPHSPAGAKALALEGSRLMAGDQSAVGSVLQGAASDGQPVEVAICDAEPSPVDPSMVKYRIEAWNPVAQEWENPCVPTGAIPNPRALVVSGTWDASGARSDAAGKITFACETGVISKCASWGYKPWASHDGRSLKDAHQACTRMARADYCGNGRSHTRESTTIDYYDSLGLSTRTTVTSATWDPARASFEAAWTPDGASCLARTRTGESLEEILRECPGRFQKAEVDLGNGDRCAVSRVDRSPAGGVRLRNRVNGAPSANLPNR